MANPYPLSIALLSGAASAQEPSETTTRFFVHNGDGDDKTASIVCSEGDRDYVTFDESYTLDRWEGPRDLDVWDFTTWETAQIEVELDIETWRMFDADADAQATVRLNYVDHNGVTQATYQSFVSNPDHGVTALMSRHEVTDNGPARYSVFFDADDVAWGSTVHVVVTGSATASCAGGPKRIVSSIRPSPESTSSPRGRISASMI